MTVVVPAMSPVYSVGMTAQQKRAYEFIRAGILAGLCPSYDEISLHIGTSSKSGVYRIIDALVKRKLLIKGVGARNLTLTDPNEGRMRRDNTDFCDDLEVRLYNILSQVCKRKIDVDSIAAEINAARVVVFQKRMENMAPLSVSAILELLTTKKKEA